jgi:hypothetical protein
MLPFLKCPDRIRLIRVTVEVPGNTPGRTGDAMTESEWDACTEPQQMLAFLRDSGKGSVRKSRLLACACVRGVLDLVADERSRGSVEVAEQFADGTATLEQLASAYRGARRAAEEAEWEGMALASLAVAMAAGLPGAPEWEDSTPKAVGWALWRATQAEERVPSNVSVGRQCDFVRCIFGPLPFRSVTVASSVLAWNDGTAVRLALAAYAERQLPAGTLDPARLAVLADALEEAGCTDAGLLGHLRGEGPHVRGCWAVDLILERQ